MKVEYTETITQELEETMEAGHIDYEKHHGIDINYKKFAFVIKDETQIIAALIGYTAFEEIYVDDLWVDKSYRKQGLGRLLLETVENKFKNLEYDNINLVTNGFQAPNFYKKCGFELEFIRKNRSSPKLDKYFFIKHL